MRPSPHQGGWETLSEVGKHFDWIVNQSGFKQRSRSSGACRLRCAARSWPMWSWALAGQVWNPRRLCGGAGGVLGRRPEPSHTDGGPSAGSLGAAPKTFQTTESGHRDSLGQSPYLQSTHDGLEPHLRDTFRGLIVWRPEAYGLAKTQVLSSRNLQCNEGSLKWGVWKLRRRHFQTRYLEIFLLLWDFCCSK